MARKRSTNRRRRRGRFSALVRLLCTLLIACAIVAAMTLFFKVQTIVVDGGERYGKEEIIAASGVKLEDNLFLLNKYSVAQTIFEKLPYVEEAAIHRKLPDTLVITVRECAAAAGIETDGGFWLISENGKLLELVQSVPHGCPTVSGVELIDPAASGKLSLGEEHAAAESRLLGILHAANEYGMLAGVGSIDLSDATAIEMDYLGRFRVKLPWDADMDRIFRAVQMLANSLEANETGEVNLMMDDEIHFIPAD